MVCGSTHVQDVQDVYKHWKGNMHFDRLCLMCKSSQHMDHPITSTVFIFTALRTAVHCSPVEARHASLELKSFRKFLDPQASSVSAFPLLGVKNCMWWFH